MNLFLSYNQHSRKHLISISDALTPQLQAPSAQPQVAQLQEADPQPGMMIEIGIEVSKSGL